MLELLPCPFCGATASFTEDNSPSGDKIVWLVGCDSEDCPAMPLLCGNARKVDAAKAWNTRAASVSRKGETMNRNEAIDLLPCPFCGASGELEYSTHLKRFYYPTCTSESCPAFVEVQDEQGGCAIECKTREDAAAIWNRRAASVSRKEIVENCSSFLHEIVAKCQMLQKGSLIYDAAHIEAVAKEGLKFIAEMENEK
jgi:hypothetical protein